MPSIILQEDFRQNEGMLDRWMYNHQRQHEAIVDAIRIKYGYTLIKYNLYPFTKANELRWLQDHQQAHLDLTTVLNLDSQDFQNLDLEKDDDFKRWLSEHWLEHYSADKILNT